VGQQVAILTISHRHGTNVYPCSTEKAAGQQLKRYVASWWSQVFFKEPIPDDLDEAVSRYFEETRGHESYGLKIEELIEEEPDQKINKDKLVKIAAQLDSQDLDDLVHDAYAELASGINNEGQDGQLDTLIGLGWREDVLERELRRLLSDKLRRIKDAQTDRELGLGEGCTVSYEEWSERIAEAEGE
jgi:hypothetical protein